MKAKDLKPGQEFKLEGQRKFRTVTRIDTFKATDKVGWNMVGKVLILHDNCKQLVLAEDQEVIVNGNDVVLPSIFLANPRMEPKEYAVESVFYKHEEYNFNPCCGLMYWLRWGKYIFDIRDIRKLYGVNEQDNPLDVKVGQENFTAKIKEMLSLIGDESFKNVLLKVNERQLAAEGCACS
jgi:hypothetical protein